MIELKVTWQNARSGPDEKEAAEYAYKTRLLMLCDSADYAQFLRDEFNKHPYPMHHWQVYNRLASVDACRQMASPSDRVSAKFKVEFIENDLE